MSVPEIGQSLPRTEDERFLTGQGNYIDDINLDGQAHAVVVRSTHAHARINAIDVAQALALDGVLLVVTPDDWKKEGFGPMPTKTAIRKGKNDMDLAEPPRHCLAMDKVRYVGEPVALVVAETAAIAIEAAELVDIDYVSLDVVVDPKKALIDGAPQLWDDIANNLCLDFELGDAAATQAAFDKADHVVTLEVFNNRVTAVPIEPRGAVASYSPETDSYLLYNATQNVHANRDTFAESVLGIEKEKLHHIAPDVGGGFGVKNGAYPEPPLILYASKRLGRAVKWINTRSESFVGDTHGRGQDSTVELALNKDGKFIALRTTTIGAIGAFCWTVGPFTPTGGSARTQGGPYGFEAMYYQAKAVFTNTHPMDPYRGAGRPEGSFQIERVVEKAARELGFDPVELRRLNLIPRDALPLKTPMGLDVDCGDFPEVFERTLKLSDRAGFDARLAASREKRLRRGFAIAPYLECTGGGPKEFAGVTFVENGTVDLAVGSQSTGMGHETAMPQILAANLGLPFDDIRYHQADTDKTPIGGGHGGSRNLEVGGSAVLQAAGEVIEKGKVLAAHIFETTPEKITFEDGAFAEPGTNHSMTMREIIDASFDPLTLPDGMEPGGLNVGSTFERGIISVPNGCHAAEVEVDPETGKINIDGYWVVDDFGTIINPMLADGQVMGGVAQGIGQALMEEAYYEEDTGQLVTGSLIDYALPRADDIPNMVLAFYEDAPTAKNPLGVKGAGEAGCCGAPPAVVNAVLDALKDYGIENISMPLTPEKVWRAIHAKG
ncbi:MAG: xanthine dehydrogenase family protein molybdopterin-binding subunit [Proteobacteria bacterium]|nr:xanthine dehydrogenase family protein molybdopterin-binding subunit [Pseudomonadota bacterium]